MTCEHQSNRRIPDYNNILVRRCAARLAACGAKCLCQQRLRLCADEEEAGALEGDWREMRAKLVAQESGAAANEGVR